MVSYGSCLYRNSISLNHSAVEFSWFNTRGRIVVSPFTTKQRVLWSLCHRRVSAKVPFNMCKVFLVRSRSTVLARSAISSFKTGKPQVKIDTGNPRAKMNPDQSRWHSSQLLARLPNMFSTATNKPHSARKRIISNIYSKSFLASSSSLKIVTQQLLHESFIPRLATYARCATPVDIYATFSGVTMDLVSGYMCGTDASTNFSDDIPARTHILDVFNSRPQYLFYVQEIPLITSLLQRLGIHLIPHRIDAANAEIEAWAMKIFDGARAALPNSPAGASNDSGEAARYPTVYAQLTAAMTKDPEKATIDPRVPPASTHLAIASECFDHLAAGFDTSGITLTYLVWELSQRPALQKALRDELLTLSPPLAPVTAEKPELPLFKALDALPLLQAILQETIRRHPAIPGPQPRVTPASESGTTLGPPGHEYAGIPAGVRVSCQAYSLHRNAAVFPEPEAWKPERWLNANGAVVSAEDGETAREMGRWFWGFGSGGRMCVGSNLAIYREWLSSLCFLPVSRHEWMDGRASVRVLTNGGVVVEMKYIVAAIYSNFETAIVNDTGIEQRDMYTAPPSGGKLIIRLTAV